MGQEKCASCKGVDPDFTDEGDEYWYSPPYSLDSDGDDSSYCTCIEGYGKKCNPNWFSKDCCDGFECELENDDDVPLHDDWDRSHICKEE